MMDHEKQGEMEAYIEDLGSAFAFTLRAPRPWSWFRGDQRLNRPNLAIHTIFLSNSFFTKVTSCLVAN
jgi:hypothetical protein